MNKEAVQQALKELARELAPLLGDRAEAIRSAFEAARVAAPDDREKREQLRILAHRLRGTAGSHGFTAISDDAGHIEEKLIAAGDGAIDATSWTTIAGHVEGIRVAAARAAREVASEAP